MSTTICAVCLLASVTGAEPAGVAYVSEPTTGPARVECPLAVEPLMRESESLEAPIVVCRDCRMPEPLLYVDTECSTRWYTMLNVGYYRQPYNYLVRFDYPWHPEPNCARCWQAIHPAPQPQAVLAPLETAKDTRKGGSEMSRPSAIRRVD